MDPIMGETVDNPVDLLRVNDGDIAPNGDVWRPGVGWVYPVGGGWVGGPVRHHRRVATISDDEDEMVEEDEHMADVAHHSDTSSDSSELEVPAGFQRNRG